MTKAQSLHDRITQVPLLCGLYGMLYRGFLHLRARLAGLRGRTPLLVFQMGKVGSSTVVASLEASGVDRLMFHSHFLSSAGRERMKEVSEETFGSWRALPAHLKRHVIQSAFIASWVGQQRAKGGALQVICLVRDPVATNVSSFFQDTTVRFSELVEPGAAGARVDTEALTRQFFDEYHHELPMTWFDDEMREVVGLDLLAEEFPTDVGWKIYREGNVEVLLLRLEDLERTAGPACRELLGVEHMVLVNENLASDKPRADAYRQFRAQLEIPDFYLDMVYESPSTRRFYSDEEIAAFRARWEPAKSSE